VLFCGLGDAFLNGVPSHNPFFYLSLISERFVFCFIVLSLNESDLSNKWKQQDSTCNICKNICGNIICGNFLADRGKTQKLDPA